MRCVRRNSSIPVSKFPIMQTSTFTQKLPRQRNFPSFLISLFALFVGLGATQTVQAQAAYDTDYVTISATPIAPAPGTTTTYAGNANGNPPFFQGADLGNGAQFDQSNPASTLVLTGALANLLVFPNTAIPSSRVLYRVFSLGATVLPSYSVVSLNRTSPTNNSNPVTYSVNGLTVDLLRQPAVLGGGTYVVEVKFESTVTTTSATSTITDDNGGGNGFRATFSVIAPAVTPPNGTTTWIATVSTDWTQAVNWSNGVPTQFSDAIIPEKNSTNTNTSTPALLNTNPTLYNVRSLTLQGTTNATRALLRIGQTTSAGVTSGATLNVFGDLNTFGGGILASQSGANGVANPALNSTIALRGNAQQVVRGLLEVSDMRIEGTGNKLVVNVIAAGNTFTFAAGALAHVVTVNETFNPSTGMSVFALNTTKTSNVNLKSTGFLFGETNDAYIEGVALADRNLAMGVTQRFGNIGIDITPNRDITGPTVQITRTVGDPLSGPVGTSAKPIKRQYGVSGDVNNSPTVSTVTFHYLNSVDELNGNSEPTLTIFKTTHNGSPYQLVGGTKDPGQTTVTQTGVMSINTVTLGDRNNPLPVTLTTFDAKRMGIDALLTWQTATELNNKGYNVQVSTDGKEFRTIGFVACTLPNSVSTKDYSFIDTEAGKASIRYYRLQQVDVDGKTAYFAPKSVSFEGKASASTMLAYPNPFNDSDGLRVALQSATSGKGQLRVVDMTGRTISQESMEVAAGANNFPVSGLNNMGAGLYMVNFTLPGGETKTVKIVKQ